MSVRERFIMRRKALLLKLAKMEREDAQMAASARRILFKGET